MYLCNHRHIAYESLKLAGSLVVSVRWCHLSEAECQRQRQQQARSAPHSRPRGLENATREVRLNNKCCHRIVSLRRTKQIIVFKVPVHSRVLYERSLLGAYASHERWTPPVGLGGGGPNRNWGRFWGGTGFRRPSQSCQLQSQQRRTPNELFLTFGCR